MGGRAHGSVSWVSFLLIPHPAQVGGVWLGGTQVQRFFFLWESKFGMLLGPEKTSGCWWMFLWPAVLGPDRLTHSLCGGCGGGCGVGWCVVVC